MKSLGFLLLAICLVSFSQAVRQREVSVSAHQLSKCNLQDVVGKAEQLFQGGIYSVSNIVQSVGSSARDGLACIKHPLKLIPCVADVVVYEIHNIEGTIADYIGLVKTLIVDIIHDIVSCV